TRQFCRHDFACVKCAGRHESANCPRKNDTYKKCINCGLNHTSNYRGCETIVKLQQIRDKKNKSETQRNNNIPTKALAQNALPVSTNLTFAEVAKRNTSVKQIQSEVKPAENQNLNTLVRTMLSEMLQPMLADAFKSMMAELNPISTIKSSQ